jgi:hypothetical protein
MGVLGLSAAVTDFVETSPRRADPLRQAALFWQKVDLSKPNGCWPYLGFRKWDGYGWVHRDGKNMTAHRYAWILKHGKPPEGMHILHICDNPPCCNPAHLRLGTHAENMADCRAKGRNQAFTMSSAKLDAEAVKAIRAEYKLTGRGSSRRSNVDELAARYGVKPGTITSAVAGRSWSDLK